MRFRRFLGVGSGLIAAVPLAVSGVLLYSYFSTKIVEEISEKNLTLARAMQGQIESFLGQPLSVLEHLKANVDLRAPTADYRGWIAERVKTAVQSTNYFDSVFVMDGEGRIVHSAFQRELGVSKEEFENLTMSGQEFFRVPRKKNDVYWSNIRTSIVSGEPSLTIAIASGSGVLAGNINLKWLDGIVAPVEKTGGLDVYIIDSDGVAIRCPDHIRAIQRVNLSSMAIVVEGLLGREGTWEFKDRGVARLGSTVRVPTTGWLLIVARKVEDAFSPLRIASLFFVLSAFLAMIVSGVGGIALAELVTRPLARLQAEARKIASGEFRLTPTPSVFDEIDDLGHSLAEMAREIRKRESALRGRERELKDIIAAADNVALFITDLQGKDTRILDFSPGAEKMFDYRRDEVLLKPVSVLHLPEVADKLPEFESALRRGEKGFVGELTLVRRSGDSFPALFAIHPSYDGAGNLIGTVEIAVDISAQKAVENALRESEQRLRDLLECSADFIWEIDGSGAYSYVSPKITEILGYETSEVVGKTPFDLMPPSEAVRMVALIARFSERRAAFSGIEIEHLHKDGHLVVMECSAVPILSSDSEFLGYRGVDKNVTDRKRHEEMIYRAKEEAELANRAKTEFLANMSHELRTPLTMINGGAEMMAAEMFGPIENAKYREYAHHIKSSGEHLLALINDLLDITRIEMRHFELRESTVDVARCLRECAAVVENRAREHGLSIELRVEDSSFDLWADDLRVRQVLLNLLSNAVKFTDGGGQIIVTAFLNAKQSHEIAVSDTGIGISGADLVKVMAPFGQVENAYSRQHGGVGLGLPISKRLMEMHGGTLVIHSRPGEGTTVTMTFPADRSVPRTRH